MRKRKTFIITLISHDEKNAEFSGCAKDIATGESVNFTSLDHLQDVLKDEMAQYNVMPTGELPEGEKPSSHSDPAVTQ